jgi:hypothetical protein
VRVELVLERAEVAPPAPAAAAVPGLLRGLLPELNMGLIKSTAFFATWLSFTCDSVHRSVAMNCGTDADVHLGLGGATYQQQQKVGLVVFWFVAVCCIASFHEKATHRSNKGSCKSKSYGSYLFVMPETFEGIV